ADELEQCFAQAQTGPLTQRLAAALDRYLAFVDEHDAGFMALLQGGSVVQTSRTHAIVDEVRRAAAGQILFHLGFAAEGTPGDRPGLRLRMTVRNWITVVEGTSLIWLDEDKQPPLGELRDWLVDHFLALLLATAAGDAETAGIVRHALAIEDREGPVGDLARRVLPVVADAGHLI
ncbi:MAG: TetR/AcrR family transcriptional regulator, partial [Streptomyces sp.]